MIRKLEENDRQLYMDLTAEFYTSEAVLHNIPESYREETFKELMSGSPYAECWILESGDKPAGYALLNRGFSQECGGPAVWVEELSVLPPYRGMGRRNLLFEKQTRG